MLYKQTYKQKCNHSYPLYYYYYYLLIIMFIQNTIVSIIEILNRYIVQQEEEIEDNFKKTKIINYPKQPNVNIKKQN